MNVNNFNSVRSNPVELRSSIPEIETTIRNTPSIVTAILNPNPQDRPQRRLTEAQGAATPPRQQISFPPPLLYRGTRPFERVLQQSELPRPHLPPGETWTRISEC